MNHINVPNGYDLNIKGKPRLEISTAKAPVYCGFKPTDFMQLKVKLLVRPNEKIGVGTALFQDKKNGDVKFVSSVSGTVAQIKMGPRRKLLEIVIQLDGNQTTCLPDKSDHEAISPGDLDQASVGNILMQHGLWPLIRKFPYNIIADPQDKVNAIYVQTFHKEPLSVNISVVSGDETRQSWFKAGLKILTVLCPNIIVAVDGNDGQSQETAQKFVADSPAKTLTVNGRYPACHPGVQVYYNQPLKAGESIWYLDWQGVVAIGELFADHQMPTKKIVAITGEGVKDPKYYEVFWGASVHSMVNGNLQPGSYRMVSGGIYTGNDVDQNQFLWSEDGTTVKVVEKVKEVGYVGFYDSGLQVIQQDQSRTLMKFARLNLGTESFSRTFLNLNSSSGVSVSTKLHGEERACIQCGYCEDVCPVEIMPDRLFKAVLIEDIDEAESLGLHDCVECQLCSYVCPSKIEIAGLINMCKSNILKENAL